jgi:hypothetical protein
MTFETLDVVFASTTLFRFATSCGQVVRYLCLSGSFCLHLKMMKEKGRSLCEIPTYEHAQHEIRGYYNITRVNFFKF